MNKNNFDRQARDLIINDIRTNYFVEAGAGSGKTTCLVSRMVNMVLSGIEVDKICAITFTKAAANEFYERFLKKLIELRDKSKNNKENELLNNAIKNIDMCFLGTMDSFVNTIMHEYPIEAGIPTNSKVIQDTKSYKTLVNNQLTKLIDNCESNNANSHELELFEKYKYAAYYNSNFNKNVVDICSETLTNLRDYSIKYTSQNINSKNKFDSFEKNFKYDKQILTTLCNVAHKYVILDKPDSKQYLYLDNLIQVSNILKMNWDETISYNYGLDSAISSINAKIRFSSNIVDDNPELNNIIVVQKNGKAKLLKEYRDNLLKKIYQLKFDIAMTFIVDFSKYLFEALKKTGNLTFFDYKYYFRNLLKKDIESGAQLIDYITSKHRYYLLDEFQDTPPIQSEIFFYLSANTKDKDSINSDWTKCIPRAGSLFIVGDPKQSIYRFQNADIQNYKKVQNLFTTEGSKQLQLTCNFRSSKKLCSYFNQVFGNKLFSKNSNDKNYELKQGDYYDIPLEVNFEDNECFGGVFKYSIDKSEHTETNTSTNKKINYDLYDAECVCTIINTLILNGKYQLKEKTSNGDFIKRKIQPSDIMVITKNKKELNFILDEMIKQNISTQTNGCTSFKTCPSLLELSNIFNAVTNDQENISLYATLTGRIFNLSDNDVYLLKQNITNLTLFNESNTGVKRIDNALNSLIKIKKQFKNATYFELIDFIENELRLFEKCGTYNLDYYFFVKNEITNKIANSELHGIKQVAEFLQNVVNNDIEYERTFSLKQNTNSVMLANLHKVKGLERPIVILASPYKQLRKFNIEYSVDSSKKCYIFNKSSFKSGDYEGKKDIEKAFLNTEADRLLYVAATRAKNALIIGQLLEDGKVSSKSSWNDLILNETKDIFNFFNKDYPNLENTNSSKIRQQKQQQNNNSSYKMPDSTLIFENSTSSNATYNILTPSENVKNLNFDESKNKNTLKNVKTHKRTKIKDIKIELSPEIKGTIIHKILEIIVNNIQNNLSSQKIKDMTIQDFKLNKLRELDATSQESEIIGYIEQVSNILSSNQIQNTDIGNLLIELKTNTKTILTETPFCYKNKNNLIHGFVDLIYCDRANKWHIIDYKTNLSEKNIEEKYVHQLRIYKEAFFDLTGNRATTSICVI